MKLFWHRLVFLLLITCVASMAIGCDGLRAIPTNYPLGTGNSPAPTGNGFTGGGDNEFTTIDISYGPTAPPFFGAWAISASSPFFTAGGTTTMLGNVKLGSWATMTSHGEIEFELAALAFDGNAPVFDVQVGTQAALRHVDGAGEVTTLTASAALSQLNIAPYAVVLSSSLEFDENLLGGILGADMGMVIYDRPDTLAEAQLPDNLLIGQVNRFNILPNGELYAEVLTLDLAGGQSSTWARVAADVPVDYVDYSSGYTQSQSEIDLADAVALLAMGGDIYVEIEGTNPVGGAEFQGDLGLRIIRYPDPYSTTTMDLSGIVIGVASLRASGDVVFTMDISDQSGLTLIDVTIDAAAVMELRDSGNVSPISATQMVDEINSGSRNVSVEMEREVGTYDAFSRTLYAFGTLAVYQ